MAARRSVVPGGLHSTQRTVPDEASGDNRDANGHAPENAAEASADRGSGETSFTIGIPQLGVPEFMRCPLCWGGMRGCAKPNGQYPPKGRVYLKCEKCGHDWIADLRIEVVAIDHRLPGEISTR